MKKIIAMLLTVIFGFSFSPVYVKATKINSIAYGEKYSKLKSIALPKNIAYS